MDRRNVQDDYALTDRRRYVMVRRGCVYALLGAALVVLAALAVIVLARDAWLPLLAHFLVYREAPRQADAIIVLGGGDEARSALGAELYRSGFAPVVIAADGGESYAPYRGESLAGQLGRAGVPDAALMLLDAPETTHQEAQMALALLRERAAKRVILVTDTFHSRRARSVFVDVFAGSDIEVVSVPSEPAWFAPDHWWRDERSALAVFNEYAKLLWFWLGGHG